MLRAVFLLVVIIHGFIHLIGFVNAFGLAKIDQMTGKTLFPLSEASVKGFGLLWLISCVLFLLVGLLFIIKKEEWWMVALPAVIFSQMLIIVYWQDAKFGTIANLIILVGMAGAFGAWQFGQMTRYELSTFLPQKKMPSQIITEEDILRLPPSVQKWMYQSNVVGKAGTQSVYLNQKGEMRSKPDGNWMPVQARQWFTIQQPGFFWLARVKAGPGIYMAGRDKYQDGHGHMLIKLFSLIPVVDSKGQTIDQGSMLRYLAEIIWFPSAALQPYIKWEQMDENNAKATMTYGDVTASGIFSFTPDGEVKSFVAQRYFDRKEGATLETWHIENDPASYQTFSGVRIPTRAEVTWKLADGDFTWYKLEISGVRTRPE